MKRLVQHLVAAEVRRLKLRKIQAFTRLELAFTLAALALLAVIALPALGNTKPRAQRVTCVNNLRRIGQALHLWASDHLEQNHWRTDLRDGGTYYNLNTAALPLPPWISLRNNAWFQFAWMSNELHTPKLLACPSDTKRVARDFSFNPNGGFIHFNYQDNAVSYFLGLDAFLTQPRSLLAGDRNLRTGGESACSTGLSPVPFIRLQPTSAIGWTNAIHGPLGHVLFHDGQVEQLSTRGLVNAFNIYAIDDNGSAHYLVP